MYNLHTVAMFHKAQECRAETIYITLPGALKRSELCTENTLYQFNESDTFLHLPLCSSYPEQQMIKY